MFLQFKKKKKNDSSLYVIIVLSDSYDRQSLVGFFFFGKFALPSSRGSINFFICVSYSSNCRVSLRDSELALRIFLYSYEYSINCPLIALDIRKN